MPSYKEVKIEVSERFVYKSWNDFAADFEAKNGGRFGGRFEVILRPTSSRVGLADTKHLL